MKWLIEYVAALASIAAVLFVSAVLVGTWIAIVLLIVTAWIRC